MSLELMARVKGYRLANLALSRMNTKYHRKGLEILFRQIFGHLSIWRLTRTNRQTNVEEG